MPTATQTTAGTFALPCPHCGAIADPDGDGGLAVRLADLSAAVWPKGQRFEDFDRSMAECRPLMMEFARHAAADLRAAEERLRAANERYKKSEAAGHVTGDHNRLWAESEEWQRWVDMHVYDVDHAEKRMMTTVLLFNGDASPHDLLENLKLGGPWEGAALHVDDVVYAVGPDPSDDTPVLVVVPPGRFSSDDDGQPDWPDRSGDEGDDEVPPPRPTIKIDPEPSSPREDATAFGLTGAADASAAIHQALPVAWSVTESTELVYHCHCRKTLDEVLAEIIDEYGTGEHDLAVWRAGKLHAVIRTGADGEPVVTRFDGVAL